MDWVNLLQDGAIICLAVALIASSCSIHGLRKRIKGLDKSKQDKDIPLLVGYSDSIISTLPGNKGYSRTSASMYELSLAHDLNPVFFRKGDSVRLSGLHGEFILTGYSDIGFAAVKHTNLFDMGVVSSVAVSTTVHFHADRVTAWKRNTGEWPVEWFMGTGNKREEGGQDDHARRVNDRNKKNAAGSSCGSDKRRLL